MAYTPPAISQKQFTTKKIFPEVTSVDIQPNACGVRDPLAIKMEFDHAEQLESVHWRIRYVVDTVKKRKIYELGETEKTTYSGGCVQNRKSGL